MADLTVTREDEGSGGRYVARLDGHEAELTYARLAPDLVSADHTGVPYELSGKGVGSALVRAMIADAEAEGFRIVPRCSFVAAQARRHPDWAPLFAQADES